MAGAGYKLFNTGDVLTAAQVNTYLQEQVVMVFADATARTTALSGVLAEGMCSYLKSTKVVEIYNGTAWASLDDPNAIQNTIVDAKGDLITATANDTPARLAVGSNGDTLVADSAASTGLRWQGNYSGGKNFLINGGFDIWQRGTSSGSAGYQTADRWYENASNSTTFAQETSTIQDNDRYALKMTAGATAQMWIQQPIETLNATALAGRTVAVSVSVRASTTVGMTINVYSSTTVDNTAAGSWGSAISPTTGGTGNAVSSSWTRISGTYAIPSNAKSVMVQIITTSTVSSGVIVYLSQAQLEIGSVPTAFTRAGGTIQGELAACQRYYQKSFNIATAPAQNVSTGNMLINASVYGAAANFFIRLPVTMRTAPTVTTYNPYAANASWRLPSSSTDVAITISNSNEGTICGTAASTSATAMHAHWSGDAEL